MKSQFRYVTSLFAAAVIAVIAGTAAAQEFRGTITGTVTDPNSAVVPGASVTVKNTETNIAATATTNDQGSYTVPLLLPGTYTVSATASGFKTTTVQNVLVKVDDQLTMGIHCHQVVSNAHVVHPP